MSNSPDSLDLAMRRLAFIREETRFEINLLHERVNGLISAEAFLSIAFTAAISNTNARWGTTFSIFVAPLLAVVGVLLALFALPGVNASFKIILEWNVRQIQVMQNDSTLSDVMWRSYVMNKNGVRADPDQRVTMLFARAVPIFLLLHG